MSTMEQVDLEHHFSLFKGEPGTRKSTQALGYPKPQYWFDFDGKMNALAIPMQKWGIKNSEIEFDSYNDWNKAEAKMRDFQTNCKFKTIVLDSITSAGDTILRGTIRDKGNSTRKSGQAAGKVIGGIEVNELEDFNAESAAFNEMIALLKDIKNFHKIDIILIAHIIRTEQKSPNGTVNVSRQIVTAAKKNAAKIPAYADETYLFGVENDIDVQKGTIYNVTTSHVGEDYARTSLPLSTRILLGGEACLYKDHILPAINQLVGKKG